MRRYEVTIKVSVLAPSFQTATEKMQKLVDTINAKDPKNKAWIPQVKQVKP